MHHVAIAAAFFDIGGALGDVNAELVLTLYPDTLSMLTTLHVALGLRLGVISNTPPGVGDARVALMLDQAGLRDLVDMPGIVTSADFGQRKPEKAIFKAAAARFNLAPAACLFIGEAEDEVQGALEAGLQALRRPVQVATFSDTKLSR